MTIKKIESVPCYQVRVREIEEGVLHLAVYPSACGLAEYDHPVFPAGEAHRGESEGGAEDFVGGIRHGDERRFGKRGAGYV